MTRVSADSRRRGPSPALVGPDGGHAALPGTGAGWAAPPPLVGRPPPSAAAPVPGRPGQVALAVPGLDAPGNGRAWRQPGSHPATSDTPADARQACRRARRHRAPQEAGPGLPKTRTARTGDRGPGGGWGRAATYRGRSAGLRAGRVARAPPRRRREDDGSERNSKLRFRRAPRPVLASNAAAAAAASGFMAKTPAPLPLPPPPPPRAEVPVTRRSTPGLRGRSPASAVRHVQPPRARAWVTWHKHVCPQWLRPSLRPGREQGGAMLDPPADASAPELSTKREEKKLNPLALCGGRGTLPSSSSTCTH